MAILRRTRTEPDPATLADVEATLAALDRERLIARSTLAAFTKRERDLIEQDAADAELDALDEERRQAERTIARLEVRERALLRQAADLRDVEQKAKFADLIARYAVALERMVEAFGAAIDARQVLVDLRGEASRVGMERIMPLLPIPHSGAPLTHTWLDHFSKLAPRELASLQLPDTPQAFDVHFTRATTLPREPGRIAGHFRQGETAAFGATQALELVRRGAAVWVAKPAEEGDAA